MTRLRGALALGLSLALAAAPARAGDVEACVKAAELGQAARRSDRLLEAKSQFIRCASDACPAVIRSDCARWLDDVDARIPAVSVRATSEGADVAARVSIDGVAIADAASKSIPLDPGKHTFRAEADGYETAEQSLVVAQGEKARVVTIAMKTKVAQPLAPEAPPPPDEGKGTTPFVYPALGLGALALGTFTVFAISGRSDASDLRDGCGKTATCAEADVDAVRSKYLVADISLTIGLVALGTAAILWLTSRP
ncbi:MAG: PEGA domain-containing protein [Labilithrix sp.]|nr:PEGA domain-containing protein [Labilithrix sp.]